MQYVETANPRIGEMLVQAQLVKSVEVDEALAEQQRSGGRLVEILIKKGFLDLAQFTRFVSFEKKTPSINLKAYDVDRDVTGLIPREFAEEWGVFPVSRLRNQLTVAMVFPLNHRILADLESLTGLSVRALLCREEDLREMIDRSYGSCESTPESWGPLQGSGSAPATGALVRMRQMAAVINKIDAFPPLPITVQRCQAVMDDGDTSASELTAIIEADPPVAANVLRLVNSAGFGLRFRVSDIIRAVTLLGVRQTCMAVLAEAVGAVLPPSPPDGTVAFHRRAVFAATVCKCVAEVSQSSETGVFFTAGLLHDMGRLVLASIGPDRYCGIKADYTEDEVCELEEELFGITHCEAGYVLATNWGLPDELRVPMRFHHTAEAAPSHHALVKATAFASELWSCHITGAQSVGNFLDDNREWIAAMGLDTASVVDVVASACSAAYDTEN